MIEDIAFFSERGLRDINQDAIYASAKNNRGIFVVADGMGGHAGGEIASSAIVNGIRNWWDSNDFIDVGIDLVAEQCNTLLLNINMEVFSYFKDRGQMGGSTVVVLLLWEDRYAILAAGDSRVYRVNGKDLEQLTTDDVWENLPDVKYEMSSERIMCDARLGKLTEAVGSEERLRIRRHSGILLEREVFLLCSDGVYKCCAQKELERIMCKGKALKSADRTMKMIRKCVLKSGVDDNYSLIICRVKRNQDAYVEG